MLLAAAMLAAAPAVPALGASSPAKARTAPAKGARGVVYAGSTSAQTPIVIGLSRDGSHVTRLVQHFRATCASGNHVTLFTGPGVSASIAKDGSFGVVRTTTTDMGGGVSARETVTLAAKVTGLNLRGSSTLHVDVIDVTGAVTDTCDQALTFRAASSAGKVFGGQSSSRTPVVIELAGGGTMVHHFHIGWTATCTPAGPSLAYGDTLRNFPVVAGRFGGRFADVATGSDGQTKLAYSIRGRITGPKTTGTFRLVITHTDLTGAVTTCDTGSMAYRATSG